MVATDPIVSERLMLPLLTAGRLERLLAGETEAVAAEIGARLTDGWLTDHTWLMRVRLRQIQEDSASEPWLMRPIVLRAEPPEAIGVINFHGPPDDRGFAEVGYEVRAESRGRGYAIEAVRAMFDWAAREHGIRRFRAAIGPDNGRSVNLVRKLGMIRVGAQWDELDGLEFLYVVDGWAVPG